MITNLIYAYLLNTFAPKKKFKKIPFLYIDLVNHCNSKCITCDIWKNPQGETLTTDQWLNFFKQLPSHGVKLVSIGGGEPTLNKDLPILIKELKALGIKVHLNSHLATCNDTYLKSLTDAGLDAIHVSVDGVTEASYQQIRGINALKAVEKNINWIKQNTKILVGINTVVGKHNFNNIDDIVNWSNKLNVKKLQFIPVSNNLQQNNMSSERFTDFSPTASEVITKYKSTLKSSLRKLQKVSVLTNSKTFIDKFEYAYVAKRLTSCFAGRAFVTINAKGEVLACYEYSTKLNILNKTLKEILYSPEYAHTLDKVRSCTLPCHDVGSAEVSLRLNPRYFLTNLKTIIKELKSYT